MKDVIESILNSINYWQDNKNLLLQAIDPQYYKNKHIITRLLGISSNLISPHNEAKRSLWNHQIYQYRMGDDILKNTDKNILNDKEFAQRAIEKYNRAYIFISNALKASKDLALIAAQKEQQGNEPILKYMPKVFQEDSEVALIAVSRNIENLQYAPNLQKNKYFIIDIMNISDDDYIKQKVLEYANKDLFNDKKFVSQLGCFDNMCENFKNDLEYVANAVVYDISILRKTELFDESIIKAALKSDEYNEHKEYVLGEIFRYIERFHYDYSDLKKDIRDKKLLHRLFWEFGEVVSSEFI